MKDAPDPPQPVDPRISAQAQTESNAATARLQQQLGMTGTYGPGGSVTYRADPNSPSGYSQYTDLDPEQRRIYDLGVGAQQGALQTANDQIGRINTALSSQLQAPTLARGFDPGAQVQTGFNSGPALQFGFNSGGSIRGGFGNGGQVASGFDAGGQATRSFDAGGALQRDFNTGQPVQGSFDQGGNLQTSFNPGQQVQGSVGPADFNASREAATNSVLDQARSRLDPMWNQAEDKERVRLANQGLGENSTAYQSAMGNFGRAKNDAYNDAVFRAVQAGGAEDSRLFNQSLAQGQFANQAAGQEYGQNQGLAAFANSAVNDNYQRNLGAAQFGNQAAAQQYAQGQGAAQFANDATLADYGRNQGLASFANQGLAQQYAQNQGQAQFGNAAQAQRYGQNLGSAQFANEAQAQRYGQNMGSADFYNTAANQLYGQNQGLAAFNNAAAAQQYGQSEGLANFANAVAQQDFQNQAYAQNQPINQFATLMGAGGSVAMPTAYNGPVAGVSPTDVLGAYGMYDAARNQQYQAQLANQSANNASLGGLAGALFKYNPWNIFGA